MSGASPVAALALCGLASMPVIKAIKPLVFCAVAGIACAQTIITNTHPAVVGFDFLGNGTSVGPLGNDSEHDIVTTIGNPLFPAGNVRIANDGVVIAGITTGDIASTNVVMPAAGFPAGLPPGAAAILALWDDLNPLPVFQGTSMWWKEEAGVLYILWKEEYACCAFPQAATITFEVQVFANPALGAPWIQIIYLDSVFSNPLPPTNPFSSPCDNGVCATIGYVAGPAFGNNVQWSFDTASVPSGTVLSIFNDMALTASSPLGAGSVKLDFGPGYPNGSYFFAVTSTPGAFPNGWLFGLDIGYAELGAQLGAGFPFTGPLDAAGNFTLGPFQGVPPITLYAIAFGFMPGAPVPTLVTDAISYAIP